MVDTCDRGRLKDAIASARAPVTVVIPCFRCAGTIERALRSVAAQTLLPERVILVDDCSGDSTVARLHELAAQYPANWIEVIAKPINQGPGGARNDGWAAAESQYVAFLDADDSWHPRKIEIQYGVMSRKPELCLSGHRGQVVSGEQLDVMLEDCSPDSIVVSAVSAVRVMLFNEFITRSVMIRRSVSRRFEPSKKHCEDYLLWMQVIFGGGEAVVLEVPLAFAYKENAGAGGLSGNLLAMERGELDAYRKVFREFPVSLPMRAITYGFSLVKYAFRCLRKLSRRLRANRSSAVGFGTARQDSPE